MNNNRKKVIQAFDNAERMNDILKGVAKVLNTKPVRIALGESEAINMKTKEATYPRVWFETDEDFNQMIDVNIEMARDLWSIEKRQYARYGFQAAMESKLFAHIYKYIYLGKEFQNSATCAGYEFCFNTSRQAWADYLNENGSDKTKELFQKVVRRGLIKDLPDKEALYAIK